MIKGKSVLAVIPARGGSKGVKRKNIRSLAGKPLIAWTIEAARKSKYIDRLIVSSEDAEVIRVAEKFSCESPFIRPAELARDTTPGIDPILHAIRSLPGYDYVVLLQPTSPLRTHEDIDCSLELCEKLHASTCVSVTESDKSPYWMFTVNPKGILKHLVRQSEIPTRRQDLPKVYVLNGAIYIAKIKYLLQHRAFITKNTISYIMNKHNSIDIDTEEDLSIAEFNLKYARRH